MTYETLVVGLFSRGEIKSRLGPESCHFFDKLRKM